jgi:hypothetical protein
MAFYEDPQCQDPRDRIFALLAISSDAEGLEIVPDYSTTCTFSHLYHDISVRLLRRSITLEPLVYACCWSNPDDDACPSWALNVPSIPIPSTLRLNVLAAHPRTSLNTSLHFNQDCSILVLKGSISDYISMPASPTLITQSFLLVVADGDFLRSLTQFLSNLYDVFAYGGITLETTASLCWAIMAVGLTWPPVPHERRSPAEQTAFHFWSFYRYNAFLIRTTLSQFVVDTHQVETFEGVLQELGRLLNRTIDFTGFLVLITRIPRRTKRVPKYESMQ